MAADVIDVVALIDQSKGSSCKFDCLVDMGAEHVVTDTLTVVCGDGHAVVIARVGHDVMDAMSKGLDGAVGTSCALMVNTLAPLAILLVVNH